MRRETLAFAQQKWPGGTLYHYGFCELAQRQAVLLCKDKSPSRAIKSDRAKVVMILSILVYTFFSRASKLMLFLHDKSNIFFSQLMVVNHH